MNEKLDLSRKICTFYVCILKYFRIRRWKNRLRRQNYSVHVIALLGSKEENRDNLSMNEKKAIPMLDKVEVRIVQTL